MTLTTIPRAEAIRRFKRATHVTVTARTFRGADTPNSADGTPVVGVRKEVARVTSTGVYYVVGHSSDGARKLQERYASTRFPGSPDDTWHEDADGNLVLTTYVPNYAEHRPGARVEYARITYKLEGVAR